MSIAIETPATDQQKTLRHLPATASGEEISAALTADGAVIVDNVVAPAAMDTIFAELKPFIEATAKGRDDFSGKRTQRTGALIARSPMSRDFVMHPTVLAACSKFLAHVTSYQLHLTQVIAIGPNEPAQTIHRDQWAFDFFPFPKGYEVQCNTIWAMTDFTEENGATRVIPGSNHLEDRLRFEEKDTIAAEMSKGSVLFYSGSVYHGGGANRSDKTRYGINITYNVSWLRQEENQYLATPLEIARTLPVELLRLMGYRLGAYALGYVGDTLDPIEIVRPELKRAGFSATPPAGFGAENPQPRVDLKRGA
ncbi:MAG: phytanoyl-CoA dioxygenase family protein [Candidatus Binataceae bacterium]